MMGAKVEANTNRCGANNACDKRPRSRQKAMMGTKEEARKIMRAKVANRSDGSEDTMTRAKYEANTIGYNAANPSPPAPRLDGRPSVGTPALLAEGPNPTPENHSWPGVGFRSGMWHLEGSQSHS